MLAVVWANEFATGLSDDPRFDDAFGPNEVYARALVNRAIDDWNKVVLDQNYDNNGIPGDNNLALTIQAVDLAVQENNPSARGATYIDDITTGLSEQAGWKAGVPRAATIYMDDDGASSGWFFDATPTDDVEFTGIVGPYQANFVDATTVGQQHQNDFYRTIAHEIGHALGIALWPGLRIHNFLTPIDSNNDDTNEVDTSLSLIHI